MHGNWELIEPRSSRRNAEVSSVVLQVLKSQGGTNVETM
jgi:hypothetical protein